MDKTGDLKPGSPCVICGRPSVIVNNTNPVCEVHNLPNLDTRFTAPAGANKVASVLEDPK